MPDPNHWQPIDTAPRDGTTIIVWPPTWRGATSCATWDDGLHAIRPRPHWRRLDALGNGRLCPPPTHWRPVLAGPGVIND